MRFSQGSIPEILVWKKITIYKVIQRLIDPCEKCNNILGGHDLFLVRSKLEAMAIYVVKQAFGNDIMASV